MSLEKFKIPLPTIEEQEKIISEIKILEKQEQKAVEEVEKKLFLILGIDY